MRSDHQVRINPLSPSPLAGEGRGEGEHKRQLYAAPSAGATLNLRLHRIRNKTLLMRPMVQFRFFFRRWPLLAAIQDLRMQMHDAHPKHTAFILRHLTKPPRRCSSRSQSPASPPATKNVSMWQLAIAATNASSGSTFAGFDHGFGTTPRRRRSGNGDAAIERPSVLARILPLQKIRAILFPLQLGDVFGHKTALFRGNKLQQSTRLRPRQPFSRDHHGHHRKHGNQQTIIDGGNPVSIPFRLVPECAQKAKDGQHAKCCIL